MLDCRSYGEREAGREEGKKVSKEGGKGKEDTRRNYYFMNVSEVGEKKKKKRRWKAGRKEGVREGRK